MLNYALLSSSVIYIYIYIFEREKERANRQRIIIKRMTTKAEKRIQ